jgi:hypothetical protein
LLAEEILVRREEKRRGEERREKKRETQTREARETSEDKGMKRNGQWTDP